MLFMKISPILCLDSMALQTMLRPYYLSLLCGCLVVTGCSSSNDGMVTVSGEVLLDGAALETGNLALIPKDGLQGAFGADIVDGKFQIQTTPGDKIVQITSYRTSTTRKGPDGSFGPEQYLPDRYNKKSELELSVAAEGTMGVVLELQSK